MALIDIALRKAKPTAKPYKLGDATHLQSAMEELNVPANLIA